MKALERERLLTTILCLALSVQKAKTKDDLLLIENQLECLWDSVQEIK